MADGCQVPCETVIRLDERMDALSDSFKKATGDLERATDQAEARLDARLTSMNEFRQQITSERGEFATHKELDLKLVAIEARLIRHNERQEVNWQWGIGIGVAILLGIIALIMQLVRT